MAEVGINGIPFLEVEDDLEDVNFTPADEEDIMRRFPWIQAEADQKIAKLKMT